MGVGSSTLLAVYSSTTVASNKIHVECSVAAVYEGVVVEETFVCCVDSIVRIQQVSISAACLPAYALRGALRRKGWQSLTTLPLRLYDLDLLHIFFTACKLMLQTNRTHEHFLFYYIFFPPLPGVRGRGGGVLRCRGRRGAPHPRRQPVRRRLCLRPRQGGAAGARRGVEA